MREGWINNDYAILFDEFEFLTMTEAYGINDFLPHFKITAIFGWDDFLLVDEKGRYFRVPTVPLSPEYMEEFPISYEGLTLVPDNSFSGRIKWYVKPVAFGGDPNLEENMTWVDIQTHQHLVKWWNERYRAVLSGK